MAYMPEKAGDKREYITFDNVNNGKCITLNYMYIRVDIKPENIRMDIKSSIYRGDTVSHQFILDKYLRVSV